MTIFDALISRIQYPMPESFFQSVLIGRELDGSLEFTHDVAVSDAFNGCFADCLIGVVNAPNISEGGMSVSVSDKDRMIEQANSIYSEIGEKTIGSTVTFLD
ncbi:MAG: hypothetical protein PHH23_01710 [Paludibacteraceae bacterium]|nr:hypothetical protein [Paludibacteraceae bacterium]